MLEENQKSRLSLEAGRRRRQNDGKSRDFNESPPMWETTQNFDKSQKRQRIEDREILIGQPRQRKVVVVAASEPQPHAQDQTAETEISSSFMDLCMVAGLIVLGIWLVVSDEVALFCQDTAAWGVVFCIGGILFKRNRIRLQGVLLVVLAVFAFTCLLAGFDGLTPLLFYSASMLLPVCLLTAGGEMLLRIVRPTPAS